MCRDVLINFSLDALCNSAKTVKICAELAALYYTYPPRDKIIRRLKFSTNRNSSITATQFDWLMLGWYGLGWIGCGLIDLLFYWLVGWLGTLHGLY